MGKSQQNLADRQKASRTLLRRLASHDGLSMTRMLERALYEAAITRWGHVDYPIGDPLAAECDGLLPRCRHA